MTEYSDDQPGTILIVDDDPFVVQQLQSLLEDEGYRINSASSGISALEILEKQPPEIILLDIVMPEMDGYETCSRLKQNQELTDLPVLFLSGLDSVDEKVNAFAVGGVDYITKPFSDREMLVRIKNHLTLYRIKKKLSLEIQQRQLELTQKNTEVKDANTALKVLLTAIEQEKQKLAATIQFNADKLILPRIRELMETDDTARRKILWHLIEKNFSQLTETLVPGKLDLCMTLTPMEIQVANLIKQDKSSKEIAEICCVSASTVAGHRKTIRKKLGLTSQKVNLRVFLSAP